MKHNTNPRHVLVAIDDEPQILDIVKAGLSSDELSVLTFTDPDQGFEHIRNTGPQIVLLDIMMPKMSGMELLEKILHVAPGTDVILMTAYYSTESAVEAIKKGAADYLNKPFPIEVLRERVAKLLGERQERLQAAQLDRELVQSFQLEGMIGRSPLILDVFALIRRVAPHYRSVLITGATGTGKELVARALHNRSPVSASPFATCNCSALVETLVESELFGYVRGAFTGANQDKMGLFEYANGGTIFLDEIAEMPLASQAKLLRVLQNQEIQRLGSPSTRKIDVRVVAATNQNIPALVAEKRFREDLYYRLSMVEITVPSLVDRYEDIPLLLKYFIDRLGKQYDKPIQGLTRRAQTLLSRYDWPGNVRELENALGHACMMVEGEVIDIDHLPERIRNTRSQANSTRMNRTLTLDEHQRQYVAEVLDQQRGNKLRAAEILGISRATLYRILQAAAAIS